MKRKIFPRHKVPSWCADNFQTTLEVPSIWVDNLGQAGQHQVSTLRVKEEQCILNVNYMRYNYLGYLITPNVQSNPCGKGKYRSTDITKIQIKKG